MEKRSESVTVDLAGKYPVFKNVEGQLVELKEPEAKKRYRLVTEHGGATYYVQYTEAEEIEADAQKAAWDAGAHDREMEAKRAADEVAKFEASLNFETRITAFVDVLGWKNAVEDAANGGDREKLLALGRALAGMQGYGKFAETLQGLVQEGERWHGDPRVSQFSDCLILSFSDDPLGYGALKQALFVLTSTLIPHGLLLRGGIVRGKLYQQGALAFGPAIHEAYHLESKVASSPRIILSAELAAEWIEDEPGGGVAWRIDHDGHRFYNFLPPFCGSSFFHQNQELWQTRLNPVRSLILSMAGDTNCPQSIFAKYEWLAGYFDAVCSENPACGINVVLSEAIDLRRQVAAANRNSLVQAIRRWFPRWPLEGS